MNTSNTAKTYGNTYGSLRNSTNSNSITQTPKPTDEVHELAAAVSVLFSALEKYVDLMRVNRNVDLKLTKNVSTDILNILKRDLFKLCELEDSLADAIMLHQESERVPKEHILQIADNGAH